MTLFWEIRMNDVSPKPPITEEERAIRQAAIDYGRGTVRLEGFILPSAVEEMNARYVAGEIDDDELTAWVLAYLGR